MSTTLPPLAALDLAATLLAREGFAIAARNERGDSLYLHRPGSPWHLRLSNHARTPKQRKRRTDILTSLIIDAPRSAEQVTALVRGALRDFEAGRVRREAGATPPTAPPASA
ncbi:hypothetical protein [Methylobacterium persicinum]|uniref:Uncharacterized protein n=1 Tax=Methylobacterium persicinum TaxID=374426 RepID=A0ABU0HJF9_9HYPH|nr:hypothetical protein [Methylobacterium persicinum]MDQ0442463.1 hypothetical protein [Methylobacterium persicinum]GJE37901.1 hypothetical protein KHHGKMAE_1965 [Methylobacterium persicinum]